MSSLALARVGNYSNFLSVADDLTVMVTVTVTVSEWMDKWMHLGV